MNRYIFAGMAIEADCFAFHQPSSILLAFIIDPPLTTHSYLWSFVLFSGFLMRLRGARRFHAAGPCVDAPLRCSGGNFPLKFLLRIFSRSGCFFFFSFSSRSFCLSFFSIDVDDHRLVAAFTCAQLLTIWISLLFFFSARPFQRFNSQFCYQLWILNFFLNHFVSYHVSKPDSVKRNSIGAAI